MGDLLSEIGVRLDKFFSCASNCSDKSQMPYEDLRLRFSKEIAGLFSTDGLAHELWAVAQLRPDEGILDGVDRIKQVLRDEVGDSGYHDGQLPEVDNG